METRNSTLNNHHNTYLGESQQLYTFTYDRLNKCHTTKEKHSFHVVQILWQNLYQIHYQQQILKYPSSVPTTNNREKGNILILDNTERFLVP